MRNLILLLAVFACGLALPANAADLEYCPQTQSEFAQALIAGSGPVISHEVRLGAGKTFQLRGTILEGTDSWEPYYVSNLKISGGWNADCSARVTYDAASTVLEGGGLTLTDHDAIEIWTYWRFALDTLTIRNVPGTFRVRTEADNGTLSLRRVRYLDGKKFWLEVREGDDQRIEVRDSLFARNEELLLWSGNHSDSTILLANSTVTGNTRHGVDLYRSSSSNTDFWLYNNILYGNGNGSSTVDLNLTSQYGDPAVPRAIANIIGTRKGSLSNLSFWNLTSDPQFVSATDYRIQSTSPAKDSGFHGVQGGLSGRDVEGNPRVAAGAVDRGAYERQGVDGVILVTNTDDSGPGSLRRAIDDANDVLRPNVIAFDIPGDCPQVIPLASELPAITDTVSIHGYSQPGSAWSTQDASQTPMAKICVEITPRSADSIDTGLRFAPTEANASLYVSGLAITGFNTGIDVAGDADTGYWIWGNFIGLEADGKTVRGNSVGVNLSGQGTGTLGGDALQDRNIISGNFLGVVVDSNGHTVSGNFIGTDAKGTSARGNDLNGLLIGGSNNEVNDNLISGNTGNGISLRFGTHDNWLRRNRVGIKSWTAPADPDWAVSNGESGILIDSGANWNRLLENTIAGNAGTGVRIAGSGTQNNRLSKNSIHDNGALGIDRGTTGPDPVDNDATAAPDIANHGQNPPELFSAFGSDTAGTVEGRLRSVNGEFKIQLFASPSCDPSGHGEGRTWIGDHQVTVTGATASANGIGTFSANVAGADLDGQAITATATMANFNSPRSGSTSEFSACVTYEYSDLIFADGFDG